MLLGDTLQSAQSQGRDITQNPSLTPWHFRIPTSGKNLCIESAEGEAFQGSKKKPSRYIRGGRNCIPEWGGGMPQQTGLAIKINLSAHYQG